MRKINYPENLKPVWARFATTDSNGDMYWHEKNPVFNHKHRFWYGGGKCAFIDNIENNSAYLVGCLESENSLVEFHE